MAFLRIGFEMNGYPVELELGSSKARSAELLDQVGKITKHIEKIGGKSPGAPNTEERLPASHMAATLHDGKVYWKVFSVQGTWCAQYGVSIWPEVLEKLGYDYDKMNPTERMDLTGYDVVFSLKTDSDTGKESPNKVINLIKNS